VTRPPADRLAAGQVVTVFRSRRRSDAGEGYDRLAGELEAAARAAPGFVDFATYTGADGDHVSVVTFATPEDHAAWRDDPSHRAAQRRGRDEFYEWYAIQVATCVHTTSWERPEG
jgi:heme-degrading monooxygenase HmoA